MKLEDIDKKNIYKVPDNYFDELPLKIQSRIEKEKTALRHGFNWRLTWKIAAPALAAVIAIFFFVGRPENSQPQSPVELLAQVSTEDVIAYLEMTDITTDEILEEIDLNGVDLDFDDEPILDLQLDQESIEMLLDDYSIDEETL